MHYPRVAGEAVNIRGWGEPETTGLSSTGEAKTDARTEDLSQEIRDISKYFSDFSIRSGTRGAFARDRASRGPFPSRRSRARRFDISTTRPAVRSIRAYQYYECIKLGCILRARGSPIRKRGCVPPGRCRRTSTLARRVFSS